jgi:hypothetical protein
MKRTLPAGFIPFHQPTLSADRPAAWRAAQSPASLTDNATNHYPLFDTQFVAAPFALRPLSRKGVGRQLSRYLRALPVRVGYPAQKVSESAAVRCRSAGSLSWTIRTLFPYTRKVCEYTRKVCEYTRKVCEYTRNVCEYTRNVCEYTRKVCEYTRKVCEYTPNSFAYTKNRFAYAGRVFGRTGGLVANTFFLIN